MKVLQVHMPAKLNNSLKVPAGIFDQPINTIIIESIKSTLDSLENVTPPEIAIRRRREKTKK